MIFSLGEGRLFTLTDILIDPAATMGDTPDADLKDFAILVSTSTAQPEAFHQVLTGACQMSETLQHFHLASPAQARYVELDAINNYGGRRLAVGEFEAYANAASTARTRGAGPQRHPSSTLPKTIPIAAVKAIKKGLAVQPPRMPKQPGQVKQALFTAHLLETLRLERASIRFTDGTTMQLDQFTDAVLKTPHVTQVRQGQVDELVTPGADHQVQTADAVASAIGTQFVTRKVRDLTIVIVIEGSVKVSNKFGTVAVKTGQKTNVRKGHPPAPPSPVIHKNQTNWTMDPTLCHPVIPENYALDFNGGTIVSGP